MTRLAAQRVAIIILALAAHGAIAVEIGPGDDFESAANALSSGDELVLRGGVYTFNGNITVSVNGTASAPVTIRAKDGEQPILEQATGNQNVIEINGSSHLALQGLTVRGGSHGIRLMNSDFITIEDCEIYETGDVALSANSGGTYEGLIIRRNHIHHTNGTGEGMYLGCNSDGCRIANSLIEGNYVHHTNRASVQQGDGIEIKEGSYGNIVRNNVVHDTNYPGILLYSTVGNGPPNVVEGNAVWNSNDNTMQVAADAIIRNNVILGNVAFQAHQAGSPSNIEFVHNTVINSGTAMQVRDVSGPVTIANNAIYSQGTAINLISGDLGQVTVSGNVGQGGRTGGSAGWSDGNGITNDLVAAGYSGQVPIDAFPADGGALIGSGDPAFAIATDFNGGSRASRTDAGAYHHVVGGNIGWAIREGFKPLGIGPTPPADLVAQ